MDATLSTGTSTYLSLIGNGNVFRVPIYQRDYSWEEEHWDDLWYDILELPIERKHYLGYIVLQEIKNDSREYWIIDGQQRFTTLCLFSLAITELLTQWAKEGIDTENNNRRAESIHNTYIGKYSISKLSTDTKLYLNKNNNDFFKSYISLHRKPASIARLKPSEKLLQKGFDFFVKKLSDKFPSKNGQQLTEFAEDLVYPNLIFTTITVKDDLNAYKVFETLNARGVKLSPSDLLKNYLFQQISKLGHLELDEAERRWQKINNTLGKIDFPTYLRHFWNSRNKLVRASNLFSIIKSNIRDDSKKSFDLLDELEKNVTVYVALNNASDELWNTKERNYLELLKMFGSKQTLSLLLVSYIKLQKNEFENLLSELMIIVFRYNKISGLNPNVIEDELNSTAIKVFTNAITTAREVFESIKSIYLTDEVFKNNFSVAQFNSKQSKDLVKYILIELENQISNTHYDRTDDKISIEHILPENPGSIWFERFTTDEIEDSIYRLGNLTLLPKSVNNSAEMNNEVSYEDKKKNYDVSNFNITKEYLNYEDWNVKNIKQRQERLAKIATAVWKSKYAD
jgi:uncharacterized protein with ParB-like and HNH nuclease domain